MGTSSKWLFTAWALTFTHAFSSSFIGETTPTVDGIVDPGYTLLTESTFSNATGGQTGASDLSNEASSRHRWNGASNEDLGSTRADIQSIYATWDRNNLYLALVGPNVHHNSFTGTGGINDDQGDVFIAIDTALGRDVAASGNLASDAGWGSNAAGASSTDFGGGAGNTEARAVDFEGWTPNYVVAVQYVDNGGGGGGHAEIVDLAAGSVNSEAQGLNNGSFD